MDFAIESKSSKKPGLTQCLYAVYSDLSTVAGPTPGLTQDSKVTITADHVFTDVENGWRKMFVNLYKSNLMFEGQGDQFSGTGIMRLKCFIPGDEKTTSAFIKDNPELLLLVQKNPCQTGGYWQLGNKCDAARIVMSSAKWTSGTIDGKETMGWEFDMEAIQDTIYYYEGVVTLPS